MRPIGRGEGPSVIRIYSWTLVESIRKRGWDAKTGEKTQLPIKKYEMPTKEFK